MTAGLTHQAGRSVFPWDAGLEYSQAVVIDDRIVLTAGQGAFDDAGNLVGIGDVERQLRVTFQNLEKVVTAHGANLASVARLTVHLARSEDFPTFSLIRREFFGAPFPATTVVAATLLVPGMLVEIDAIATVGTPRNCDDGVS